jgi:hypothetical protein
MAGGAAAEAGGAVRTPATATLPSAEARRMIVAHCDVSRSWRGIVRNSNNMGIS